jgi:hypothetical protein
MWRHGTRCRRAPVGRKFVRGKLKGVGMDNGAGCYQAVSRIDVEGRRK